MRVLDSHLHLWDPQTLSYTWLDGALDARYGAAELSLAGLDGVAERAAIFVQADPVPAQQLDEVRWVGSLAATAGVVGIVAGARLDEGAATEAHLAALADLPLVVGVRHLLQAEPDGFARTEAFHDGARAVAARGFTFDACVRAHQLSDVTALASAVPDLRIVLDHLGKPAVGTAEQPQSPSPGWRSDLNDLAVHPQVSCKLSGLPAEAQGAWSAVQLVPFLDAAAEAFGPERLLWGSDWPVSAIGPDGYQAGERARWLYTVMDWAQGRGLDADALFWSNARTAYGLH